jgi:hypothetical protein
MIQTKTATVYGDRSEKTGIIKVEVRPINATTEGTTFLVNDWDISQSDKKDPIHCKEVFWTKLEIDTMDAYLEDNHDFSGLTKTEKEWKKYQLALLIDTQNNLLPSGKTIYRLPPEYWELC